MRVALIALSVRGAIGLYLEALSAELGRHCQLYLFVPKHFAADPLAADRIFRFVTGSTRTRALLQLTDPGAAIRVWKQIQAIRPAVVHVFNGEGYPWTLVWAFLAQREGVPLLVTVHDPEPNPGNIWEWVNSRLRTRVLQRAQSVHVHSKRFIEVVRVQGATHVEVIPIGSLAPRFLRYRQPGIQREPIALFFGRIEAYKGLDILVEAATRLEGNIKVVIAGPGRFSRGLAKRIESHAGRFEVHNRFLQDWEVAHLFQRAAVCVLPYRQGSQSSVPMIAAAFGVPVVASAVGAFVEDVPAVGGLLVPKDDPEALASAIIQAFEMTPTYPKELEFDQIAPRFAQWYLKHAG